MDGYKIGKNKINILSYADNMQMIAKVKANWKHWFIDSRASAKISTGHLTRKNKNSSY